MKITKEQQLAIRRKAKQSGETYLQLRRRVQPTIGCDNAIVLQWRGMWLCIETDGHTHT